MQLDRGTSTGDGPSTANDPGQLLIVTVFPLVCGLALAGTTDKAQIVAHRCPLEFASRLYGLYSPFGIVCTKQKSPPSPSKLTSTSSRGGLCCALHSTPLHWSLRLRLCIPRPTHFSSLLLSSARKVVARALHPCRSSPQFSHHVLERSLSHSFPAGVAVPLRWWFHRWEILRNCRQCLLLLALSSRRLAICR